MSVSSFFSSFLPTVYGDAPEEKEKEDKEEESKEGEDKEESKEEEAPEPSEPEGEAEEEEEPEPEDVFPSIREDCEKSTKCASLAKHFHHCQERVEGGQGFKHEDCVEELPYDALCGSMRGTKAILEVAVDQA